MDQLPLITLTELDGNEAPQLSPLQKSIDPFVPTLVSFWFFVWIATGCIVLGVIARAYRKRHTK